MTFKKNLKKITIFSGAAMGAMHLINRVSYHVSTFENRLFTRDAEYYKWKLGNVFYTKQGAGAPILLIHDLNVCSCSYEWHHVKKILSSNHTVYTIDLLGCGNSDKPNLTYTNYLYVQLILDFIKDVIGERTDVVSSGASSGILLMACSVQNDLIGKAVLVNPENLLISTKTPSKFAELYRTVICTPVIGTFLYNIMVNKKTIEKDFRLDYYYDQNKITEKDIMYFYEASQKHHTKGKYLYANINSGFTNTNIIHGLPNITQPIYIFTGKENPENILAANQYQNYLPDTHIVELEKTKRFPHMERPEYFIDNLESLYL